MHQDVITFLQENLVVHFATCGADNQPRVRPFQFMLEHDGKPWFCTATNKDVYAQMKDNPRVELSVMGKDSRWLRISGTVAFSDDRDLKQMILERNPLIKQIYQSVDNPIFTLLTIDNAKAGIYSFEDEPKFYE